MTNVHIVQLNEDCTISSAHSIHSVLVKHLDTHRSVEIDLSNVKQVDLSFIQLLVSAGRTAAKTNRRFALSGLGDDVALAFSLAGLDVTDPMALGAQSQGL